MAITAVRSEQIGNEQVKRVDLNINTVGSAVIAKVIAGTGIGISSTGADAGTGDVTVNLSTPVSVANGGTGNTAFTAGSILFSNGTIITQDNANFFWDDTNNRLGIGTASPTSSLHNAGSETMAFTSTGINLTLDASHRVIKCTASLITITLPTAASIAGRVYDIKNSSIGNIDIDGNGAETIDGSATITVKKTESVTVVSDGTNWIII